MSPTARSLALVRKTGWLADVVEYYNHYSRKRHDMFQLFDIVAVRPGQIAFIQTTTKSNLSARRKKIKTHPDIDIVRKCGAMLILHGWYKVGRKWECKIEEL